MFRVEVIFCPHDTIPATNPNKTEIVIQSTDSSAAHSTLDVSFDAMKKKHPHHYYEAFGGWERVDEVKDDQWAFLVTRREDNGRAWKQYVGDEGANGHYKKV